ncbi:hypothetical protein N9055_00005, partial [Akkermansiaceae bacterium]|nr:hypothetical protein [Akkermansiaceae bacterium]
NIADIIQGRNSENPHEYIYYHNGTNLQAVRQGKWKLHLPRTLEDQPFWARKAGGNKKKVHLKVDAPMLFNLEIDLPEKKNLAAQHPEIVKNLLKQADRIRMELGDIRTIGSDQRIPKLENPQIK